MDLTQLLLEVPVRESSGAGTSSRFDFQKNWGLSELLSLHQTATDYCLIFEYHEDLIFLNSGTNPTRVSFFQIKTKQSKHWLLSALLQRPNSVPTTGTGLSHLAKLLSNLSRFPTHTECLNFVSNAAFSFELPDGNDSLSHPSVCISNLCDKQKAQIATQIQEELPGLPEYAQITHFKVSDLSLNDHSNHVAGRLADFLEQRNPGKKFSVKTIYRVLFDEVRRKNNSVPDTSTFARFIETKGITRAAFEKILHSVGLGADLEEAWRTVEQRLNAESFLFTHIRALRQCWLQYEIERMDATNLNISSLKSHIVQTLKTLDLVSLNVRDVLQVSTSELAKVGASPGPLLRREYLEAAVLLEYMQL